MIDLLNESRFDKRKLYFKLPKNKCFFVNREAILVTDQNNVVKERFDISKYIHEDKVEQIIIILDRT